MIQKDHMELFRQMMDGDMQEDIIMVEDIHLLPMLGEEYLLHYFVIGICERGSTWGQYDYKDFLYQAGDICWLSPGHVIRHDGMSDDYSAVLLLVSKSYFYRLEQQGLLPRYYYPFMVTTISLSPQQFDLMDSGLRLLGKLAASGHTKRDELIGKVCDIIATVCDEYIIQKHSKILESNKAHILIFERFYDAIMKNYNVSREVVFYAHLFSLTPKYFAAIIKQITGQSASDWINHYVIVQAKWLLQHEHQKTIQQIAHQLGFSEQASFSRFFKDKTSMTPSAFRAG